MIAWPKAAAEALKCLMTRLMDSTDPTADSVVVIGIGGFGSIAFLQLVAMICGLNFDAQSYGFGVGAIAGAVGGGVAFKTLAKGKAEQRAPNGDEIK